MSWVFDGQDIAIVVADKKGCLEKISLKGAAEDNDLRKELSQSDWELVCRELGYQSGFRDAVQACRQ